MLATTETSPAAPQVVGTLYQLDLGGSVLLKRHKPISALSKLKHNTRGDPPGLLIECGTHKVGMSVSSREESDKLEKSGILMRGGAIGSTESRNKVGKLF